MLLMMIVMMMKMKAGSRVAGKSGARLLVRGVAESHVTFAQARSSCPVRQRRRWLRRGRLSLRLLLLLLRMRMMMLLLILLMLGILNRRCSHRLVHRDSTALLVQGTAMEVAFSAGTAVRSVDRAPVPRYRLMNMVRAFRRVDMDGGAVERVGTLLHQTAWDPVRLRLRLRLQLRLLLLLLLSLPRRF